jgi:hypothetical protein
MAVLAIDDPGPLWAHYDLPYNYRFSRQESVSTEVGDSISKRKKVY